MDNLGDNLLLQQLADLQADFAATIDEVSSSTPVPWCGTWTVADLVEHLTYVHHWAAAMARSEDLVAEPTAGGLRSRYEAAVADLRDTLAGLDPDSPARTLVDDGTVSFWHRRQLHETLVHLWDLRTAAGLSVELAPSLWADTVDEAITVMHPRQVRLGRAAPAPVRLLLVAADVDRSWLLPDADGTEDAPAATLSGPAEALALLSWRRTGLDDHRLRVVGDKAAWQAVLDDHFVP